MVTVKDIKYLKKDAAFISRQAIVEFTSMPSSLSCPAGYSHSWCNYPITTNGAHYKWGALHHLVPMM